jgi:hypothetical protein
MLRMNRVESSWSTMNFKYCRLAGYDVVSYEGEAWCLYFKDGKCHWARVQDRMSRSFWYRVYRRLRPREPSACICFREGD